MSKSNYNNDISSNTMTMVMLSYKVELSSKIWCCSCLL